MTAERVATEHESSSYFVEVAQPPQPKPPESDPWAVAGEPPSVEDEIEMQKESCSTWVHEKADQPSPPKLLDPDPCSASSEPFPAANRDEVQATRAAAPQPILGSFANETGRDVSAKVEFWQRGSFLGIMGQAQIQGDKNWCSDEVSCGWKPIDRAQFNSVPDEINIGLKLRKRGFSIVIVIIEATTHGIGTERNYDVKLMGHVRKSGDTTIDAPQRHLLELPNSIKVGFLIRDGVGAPAEIDCVPPCCAFANYIFNADKGAVDSNGTKANLVDGGEIRGTENAWIVKEGTATDVNDFGKWTALTTRGSYGEARGGIILSHNFITVNSVSAAFVLYMKVQTSYFDEVYLKWDEFYAPTAITFTVKGVELESHSPGLELFSLVSTYTLCFMWPWLSRATRRIKFQGKFSETSNTNLEQNLGKEKQDVQGLEEISNRVKQNLIPIEVRAVDDKLQDGIPYCIAKPAQARILIWVMNEDNIEEMCNCGHLSPKQHVLVTRFAKFGIGKTPVAIGNSASDIGILPKADVGVGRGSKSNPWDPGGHSYAISTLPSVVFRIWDPGGSPIFF